MKDNIMLGQSKCHQETIIVPRIGGTLQLGPPFTVDFGGVPFSVGEKKILDCQLNRLQTYPPTKLRENCHPHRPKSFIEAVFLHSYHVFTCFGLIFAYSLISVTWRYIHVVP